MTGEANVTEDDIRVAEVMLRVLSDDHEPYAHAVMPAAELVAKVRTRFDVPDFADVSRLQLKALCRAFFEVFCRGSRCVDHD